MIIQVKKSKEFIGWWEEICNYIKKEYVKVYALRNLGPKRSTPIYAAPGAIEFYKKGGILTQLKNSNITFHSKEVSKKEAERHDKIYLTKVRKIKYPPAKYYNSVTKRWGEIK